MKLSISTNETAANGNNTSIVQLSWDEWEKYSHWLKYHPVHSAYAYSAYAFFHYFFPFGFRKKTKFHHNLLVGVETLSPFYFDTRRETEKIQLTLDKVRPGRLKR